jgi:hypothetical protein
VALAASSPLSWSPSLHLLTVQCDGFQTRFKRKTRTVNRVRRTKCFGQVLLYVRVQHSARYLAESPRSGVERQRHASDKRFKYEVSTVFREFSNGR